MGSHHSRGLDRRSFLTLTSRGVVGVAILGVAACSSGSDDPADTAAPDGSTDSATPDGSGTAAPDGELAWSRVNLGFVAAYVLVRGKEAAVVDTGIAGSADAIGAVLDEAGPGWGGVRHVVLTHKHPDHAGSIGDVLSQAARATGYVGADDLPQIGGGVNLEALNDGDEVFGLQIVGTPGHTAGHLAIFDPDTAVLVAGDALTNNDGLAGSSPEFTEDDAAAAESVRKLAQLAPATILVGHGDPVVEEAAAKLEELAASLG